MAQQNSIDRVLGIKELNRLQQDLAEKTGLAFVTVNFKGEAITEKTAFCSFCRRFREDEILKENCRISDGMSSMHSALSGQWVAYRCPAGLLMIAVPILDHDTYLGGFLCGQVRCKDAPEGILTMSPPVGGNYFDRVRRELEDDYQALPVLSYSEIEEIASLITTEIQERLAAKTAERIPEHMGVIKEVVADLSRLLQERDYASLHDVSRECAGKLSGMNGLNTDYTLCLRYIHRELNNTFSLSIDLLDILPENRISVELYLYSMMDQYFQEYSSRRYPILRSVFSYINANIFSDISLKDVVMETSISQGYVSRIVRESLQVSVTQYIHLKKLLTARTMFTYTGQSPATVAAQLGYSTDYFGKVFKKFEKMTVREYMHSCL